MFILRTLTPNTTSGIEVELKEHNQILGENYHLVTKEKQPEAFAETCKSFWNEDTDFVINTYGFIVCQDGSKIIPLFKRQHNYIMTSDGATFANVTLKG